MDPLDKTHNSLWPICKKNLNVDWASESCYIKGWGISILQGSGLQSLYVFEGLSEWDKGGSGLQILKGPPSGPTFWSGLETPDVAHLAHMATTPISLKNQIQEIINKHDNSPLSLNFHKIFNLSDQKIVEKPNH